ncbi:hypothetical protein GUJ93_ZPchr0006g44330 [Zizania palustris]|uniref:Uncharacterized protein n=1 Tax=Zizania palustris TaxID=103762 RepID=A0A8J5SRJ7_ZIZPA|nr:hypothetical protein GUJ93_ZPchr0006g44330 [Zizania palustris]
MISRMIATIFSLSLSPLSSFHLSIHIKQTIVVSTSAVSGLPLEQETSRILWGREGSESLQREKETSKEREKEEAFYFEGNVVWLEVHNPLPCLLMRFDHL